MKKLRIAVIASNFIRLPPEPKRLPARYAGAAEMIAWEITEGMVARGHDVTLFASGDSATSARLVSVTKTATSQIPHLSEEFRTDYEYLLLARAYQQAQTGAFDIIHSHLPGRSAFFATLLGVPTVATIHSPLTGHTGRILKSFPHSQHFVSISDAQRRALPGLSYDATIYHGVDLAYFSFQAHGGEELVFVGRGVAEKGIVDALMVSQKVKIPLSLAATVDRESAFFQNEIAPLLTKEMVWHGMVKRSAVADMMGGALALLFPIKWEEPFGLVMIEAMACGTPVVAFCRGSVPEIVEDGVTGYIVNPPVADLRIQNEKEWIIKKRGVEGLVEAVERLKAMPKDEYRQMRRVCRKHVEEHFTTEKMVEGYIEVYRKILEGHI